MNNNNDKKSATDRVLESIKAGRLKKFSGWHFLLKTILKITGVIVVSLMLLLLASFILFILHQTGAIYAPNFGLHGWSTFFTALPHLPILLSIILVVIFLMLIKRYRVVYRRPLLYSTIAIVLVIIIGGYLIARTDFHARLFENAKHDGPPVVGEFYRYYGLHEPQNIHRGTIIEMNESRFVMKNDGDEILTVIVGPETNIHHGDEFAKGDGVFVYGDRNDGTVQAFGIRKISNQPTRTENHHNLK